MEAEETVNLNVNGQIFTVEKSVLCRYSAYFQAMFSENFREHDQQEITLNNIDEISMTLILEFMRDGDIYITEHPLNVIGNLAEAASMLQIVKISEIVECTLELFEVTKSNCFEIMAIAGNASYTELLQTCAEFALSSFDDMEPEFVPTIEGLVWYLSHTELYVTTETDVFTFGLNWMTRSNVDVDPSDLLLILGCLDIKRLTTEDLFMIKCYIMDIEDTLVSQVINFLIELSTNGAISIDQIIAREITLKEKFSENIYDEVMNLVRDSRSRKIECTSIFVMDTLYEDKRIPTGCLLSRRNTGKIIRNPSLFSSSSRLYPCRLVFYKITNTDSKTQLIESEILSQTIDCYDGNYYSWNIAAWGPKKLVLVISKKATEGPNSRRQETCIVIRVYDIQKKGWKDYDRFEIEEMCCKLVVVGDTMTIFCDRGRTIIYELRTKEHRVIGNLPLIMPPTHSRYKPLPPVDVPVPILPLCCVHNNEIFIGDHQAAYKYDRAWDNWTKVIDYCNVTGMMSNMVSHGEYIFMTDILQRLIYKFKPGEDETLTCVLSLPYEFIPIDSNSGRLECRSEMQCCHLENQLIFLTSRPNIIKSSGCNYSKRNLYVEKYNEEENRLDTLCSLENSTLNFDSLTDSVSLALTPTSVDSNFSEYLRKCLNNYYDRHQ